VNLRRVVSYNNKTTLPALVIAYKVYGDATRDIDIITRNNLPDPGFVSAQLLEVLDA
jgi:prophage DNA circulation protein